MPRQFTFDLRASAPRAAWLRAGMAATALWFGACGGAAVEQPASSGPHVQAGSHLRSDAVAIFASVNEEFRLPHRGWEARLGRSLRAFSPDLILVWVPASALDEGRVGQVWDAQRPEVNEVVVPYAAERGIPVIGVSAETEGALLARSEFYEANPIGPVARDYLAARGAYHARVLGQGDDDDPSWFYGEEHARLAERHLRHLAYYVEERLGPAGPLRLVSRATGTIEDVVAAHPGARIAVVAPQDLMWFVEAALRSSMPRRVESGANYVF